MKHPNTHKNKPHLLPALSTGEAAPGATPWQKNPIWIPQFGTIGCPAPDFWPAKPKQVLSFREGRSWYFCVLCFVFLRGKLNSLKEFYWVFFCCLGGTCCIFSSCLGSNWSIHYLFYPKTCSVLISVMIITHHHPLKMWIWDSNQHFQEGFGENAATLQGGDGYEQFWIIHWAPCSN